MNQQFDVDWATYSTQGQFMTKNQFFQFMQASYARRNWEVDHSVLEKSFKLLDKNNNNQIDKVELQNYYTLLFNN